MLVRRGFVVCFSGSYGRMGGHGLSVIEHFIDILVCVVFSRHGVFVELGHGDDGPLDIFLGSGQLGYSLGPQETLDGFRLSFRQHRGDEHPETFRAAEHPCQFDCQTVQVLHRVTGNEDMRQPRGEPLPGTGRHAYCVRPF